MTDSVARILMATALEGGSIDSTITVAQDVGGIKAGTIYPEGTTVTEIITDMLAGQPQPVDVTIYYGAKDNPPTSIEGLTSKVVSSTSLIGAYSQHITAGNPTTKQGQYATFAVPTGYSVSKWYVPGFEMDIPHTLVVNGGYNIYYLNVPSYDENIGGIDYIIKVEEG